LATVWSTVIVVQDVINSVLSMVRTLVVVPIFPKTREPAANPMIKITAPTAMMEQISECSTAC